MWYKEIQRIIEAIAFDHVGMDNFEDLLENKDFIFFRNGAYSFIEHKFLDWKEVDEHGLYTSVINNYDYIGINDMIGSLIKDIYDRVLNPIFNVDEAIGLLD